MVGSTGRRPRKEAQGWSGARSDKVAYLLVEAPQAKTDLTRQQAEKRQARYRSLPTRELAIRHQPTQGQRAFFQKKKPPKTDGFHAVEMCYLRER